MHSSSISPLLSNLRAWIDTGSLGAYRHVPEGPRYLLSITYAQRASLKSKKFSDHISKVMKEVDELQRGGWTVVFTDGSSKRVGGWNQAGYGCFYGDHHPRNASAHVPEGETQSNNRGEVGAVLYALRAKSDSEKMAIVVDSEYVYDALTKHILKWEKVGWRSSSGGVSHSDLWIPVLTQMRRHQQIARFIWVPAHVGIVGNEGADQLAEQGRLSHPYNLTRFAKRPAFDDGLTRQDTDLPSHCSWVLSEPGEDVGAGGETEYTNSDRSLTSAESDSAREVEVLSDGGPGDSTDSGSEDYMSGGTRATSMSDFCLSSRIPVHCLRTNAENLDKAGCPAQKAFPAPDLSTLPALSLGAC